MTKRRLGNSDLFVAPLAFGGNVFGWTINQDQSFDLLDQFVGSGFNLVDTADVYSRWAPGNNGGESETIIGNWMKERNNRGSVIIATKVGGDMGQGKRDLSKKHIISAVENSLKRLRTDYIDLYQSHWDDTDVPVEETLAAYAQLISEGKVRWIGASNFSPKRLQESLDSADKNGLPKYQTFQPHYNLYEREIFEKELEQICVENQLGVISYYSLASGFLTGKYRTENDLAKSVRGAGALKYLNERGINILQALDLVSKKYNTTLSAIALAWLIARPVVSAPIVSATSSAQLAEIMQAPELILDAESIETLNRASAW